MEIYEKAEVNKIVINNIGLKEENMQKCAQIAIATCNNSQKSND